MKEHWREVVLIVFIIAVSIFLFSKQAESVSETIIITEICPSGCASTDHQWIEIYNKSSESIDLVGWKFWEGGVNHGLVISPSSTITSTILLPGAYAIIAQNDTVFFTDHPEVTSTVFDSVWTTLNKSGEEIGIKSGSGSDDFIEKFVYAGVYNYSLERVSIVDDSVDALSWKEHPDSSTPGRDNYWWNNVEGEIVENRIPRSVIRSVTSTVVGETVLFDASDSYDDESFIDRYVWMIEGVEYEGVEHEHIFSSTGTMVIFLTVYDTEHASSTVSRTIEVFPIIRNEFPDPVIVINEFLSDPISGEREWVELYNTEDRVVDLDGYLLYDGVGKIASVTGTIEGLGFRTIYLLSSKLNQSGDRVVFLNSVGDVTDAVSYGNWDDGEMADNVVAPKKGYSSARNSDGDDTDVDSADFSFTITPTPGLPNNITAESIPVSPAPTPSVVYVQPVQSSGEIFSPNDIVVNEFVSAPSTGEDEFVELYNTTDRTITLDEWVLRDGSGARTVLIGTVLPRGFFVLNKPKGSLNNAGDLITLFDPSGQEIDRVVYGNWDEDVVDVEAPVKGQAVARMNGTAQLYITTTITKGFENVISYDFTSDDTDNSSTTIFSSVSSTTRTDSLVPVFSFDSLPIITEILPNPLGVDTQNEFIELFNPFEHDISLTGLSLDDGDGGSKPYSFPPDTVLRAHEYRAWYSKDTKISLANTTDQVRILDTQGEVFHMIEYSGVKENKSYVMAHDLWFWTSELTPHMENPNEPVADRAVRADEHKSTASAAVFTTVAQIRNFDVGTRVVFEGVVLVPPGVLSSQYLYVGGELGVGIQVYSYKKEFPELVIGDKVSVSGELTEVSGEMRIKIARAEDVSRVDTITSVPVLPHTLLAAEVGEMYEGGFVEIVGEIVGVKGSYVYLDDGTGEVKVYIRGGSGIDKKMFEEGVRARVSGILQETKSGYQLSPRDHTDVSIDIHGVKGEKIELEPLEQSSYSMRQMVRMIIGICVGLVVVLGIKLYGTSVISYVRTKFPRTSK